MLMCLLLSALGYGLLGMSTSIALFLLARIPVGESGRRLLASEALALIDLYHLSESESFMYVKTKKCFDVLYAP